MTRGFAARDIYQIHGRQGSQSSTGETGSGILICCEEPLGTGKCNKAILSVRDMINEVINLSLLGQESISHLDLLIFAFHTNSVRCHIFFIGSSSFMVQPRGNLSSHTV